jgi:transposase-like protein
VTVDASTNGEGISYARMTVVDKVDDNTVKEIVKADVKEGQTFRSDGFNSYNAVKEEGYEHRKEIVKGRKAHKVLKRTHILISNAKAFIQGTFHGVDKKHLQAYLDEFYYRFNRRWSENQLFDRLATACISSPGVAFSELTK